MSQEDFDLWHISSLGVAFVVEKNETANSLQINLFCSVEVMLKADSIADSIQLLS